MQTIFVIKFPFLANRKIVLIFFRANWHKLQKNWNCLTQHTLTHTLCSHQVFSWREIIKQFFRFTTDPNGSSVCDEQWMFTDGNNEKSRTGLPVAVVLELRQAGSNEGDDGNDCDDRPCYAIESIRFTPHRLPLFGPPSNDFYNVQMFYRCCCCYCWKGIVRLCGIASTYPQNGYDAVFSYLGS